MTLHHFLLQKISASPYHGEYQAAFKNPQFLL
jgi:hypothetical protein